MLQLDTDAGAAAELISAAAPSSAGNDRMYLGTRLTEHGMGGNPGHDGRITCLQGKHLVRHGDAALALQLGDHGIAAGGMGGNLLLVEGEDC